MKTVKREEQFNRMSAHMININVMLTQKKKNYGKAAQINKKKPVTMTVCLIFPVTG